MQYRTRWNTITRVPRKYSFEAHLLRKNATFDVPPVLFQIADIETAGQDH